MKSANGYEGSTPPLAKKKQQLCLVRFETPKPLPSTPHQTELQRLFFECTRGQWLNHVRHRLSQRTSFTAKPPDELNDRSLAQILAKECLGTEKWTYHTIQELGNDALWKSVQKDYKSRTIQQQSSTETASYLNRSASFLTVTLFFVALGFQTHRLPAPPKRNCNCSLMNITNQKRSPTC